jgi:Ca-activated chloride channel family protein
MTALAEASNANYYYVKDAEKLPSVFAQELGASRSLLARSIVIRINAPEGVRLKEIIGRPDIEVRDCIVEIKMPEFFGAEKRRFLVRCEADGKAAGAIEAAQVELNYATADGAPAPAQRSAVRVAFTDDEKKAEASIHAEVAREYGVAQNRIAKEIAVKLADEGKAKDAVAVLRKQAAANAAAPAPMQVPGVSEENRKLEAAATELEAGGRMEKSRRKAMQFENYADKYQKVR